MFQKIGGVWKRESPEMAGSLLLFWNRNQGGQTGGGEVVPPGSRTEKLGSSVEAGRLLFLGRRNQRRQEGGCEVVPFGR